MKFSIYPFAILFVLFALRTVYGSEDVIALITTEARKLPASSYYNDPFRFIQKFDSSAKITEYYESIGNELGKGIFTRNSSDEGQEVVVLRQGEDRLRSTTTVKGTFVVLLMNKAKKKMYHPVFAYFRPNKPIEWDIWGPERLQGITTFSLGWASCSSSIYTPCKPETDKTVEVSRQEIPDISTNNLPFEQQIYDSKTDFFMDLGDTQTEAKQVGQTVSFLIHQVEGDAKTQEGGRGRSVYYPPPPPYPYPGQLVPVVPVRLVPVYAQGYPQPYPPPYYPPPYPPPYPGDNRQGDININVYDKRKGGNGKANEKGSDSRKSSNSNNIDINMGGGTNRKSSGSGNKNSGSGNGMNNQIGGNRASIDANNDGDTDAESGNNDNENDGNEGESFNPTGASDRKSNTGTSKNSKDSTNSKSGRDSNKLSLAKSKNKNINSNTGSGNLNIGSKLLSDENNGNNGDGYDDVNDEALAGRNNGDDENSDDKINKPKYGDKNGKTSSSSKGSHRNHGNGPINYITNIINMVGGPQATPPPPPPQQNNITVSLSISDTDTDIIEVVDENPKIKAQGKKSGTKAFHANSEMESDAEGDDVPVVASKAQAKSGSTAGAVLEDEYVVDDNPSVGGSAASFSGLDADGSRKSDFSQKSWVGADGAEYTESAWSSSSASKSSAKAGASANAFANNVKPGSNSKAKPGKGRSLPGISTSQTIDPTRKSDVDLFSQPGWNTQDIKAIDLKNFKLEADKLHYTGFGNCPTEQTDLKILEIKSPEDAKEQIRTYLVQLRAQCNNKLIDFLLKIATQGGLLKEKLSATSKHEFFKISPMWKTLTKPKLTVEEAKELNIATEFYIFTKTLLDKLVDQKQSNVSTVKELININTDFPTTVSELPKSPNVVNQFAISIYTLDFILSSVPTHAISLSRNLILTIKTSFIKLLQDFDRLKKCNDCDSNLSTAFSNDLISLLAFPQFIENCLSSDEPSPGPADLLNKFNTYLNDNFKHLNERLLWYTSS